MASGGVARKGASIHMENKPAPSGALPIITLLNERWAAVQEAISAGKTLDQMKEQRIPSPWQGFSNNFLSTNVFLETLYNSLSGRPNNKFVTHN